MTHVIDPAGTDVAAGLSAFVQRTMERTPRLRLTF
jgi:hypothetical protein